MEQKKFKNILAVNFKAVGDIVLSTPILKALKDKYPEAKLTFLMGHEAVPLVDKLPFIDQIVEYQKGESMLPVIRKIWRSDIALLLDFKYRSAVIPFLACIPIRAGLKHKRKLFLTHPAERDANEENIYESLNFANVITKSTGIKLDGDLSKLYVSPASRQDQETVDKLFKEHAIHHDSRIITVAPFSSAPEKDWPVSKYNEFLGKISQDSNCKVVIVGGPSDAHKGSFAYGINLIGKTKLTELVEILRRSHLFIGGCSGPLHISSAVNLPSLALYGASSPAQWAPKSAKTIYHKLDCSPCSGHGTTCKGKFMCMNSISVDEVLTAYQTLLKNLQAK